MRSSPPTAPEPDLDVDSDNSNWPGGWPDRSQYEDDIEDISNDPQYPGKLIVVNDNDDDGDGIPDFADGFNLNGLWEDPYCRNDDANWSESDLVPLVLEVPEPVDLSVATICISYWDSNPLSCYSSGDPPVYTPSWGPIRIWRKDWPPRNPRSCKEWDYQWGTYGDYVRPDSYEPWQLGLSNGCRTTTLLIEGIRPSTQFGDTEILVYVDPDGCYGPQGFAYMDAVRVTCVRIDLDVDSDNTNGFELPARTDYEDQIEDAASKPELPGKFVQVNDNDDDGDGIPDFADGFNLDDEEDNEDDQTAGEKFVPLILEIPNPLWHLPDVAQNGEVTFTYSASDPALVTKDPATGAYSLPSPEHEWDPSFKLRIWRKNGNQPRNKNSAAATENPGDFIPTGTAIKLSALGLSAGTKIITLYVEALDHTTGTQPERIQVAFDPDGAPGPLPALCTDAVRVRCIRLEFVIPDSYDEETGVPNPNAGAVPTDFVGVSDPRPTVTLEEVSNSSVRLYGDHAEITLSGIVKDPIADNVPRGKVSEGRADIDSVAVYVDGQVYEDAVPLTPQDDGAASFWRQHPYKGTFNPITVNIPLEEGTHIIRVETSANAAGNTGFDEVAVTLEKRPIPLDLEGQEPPPPPTPVTETRGLWHFDTLMPPPPFAPEPLPFEPDWSTSLVFHLDTPGYAPDASGHGYDGSLSGSVATVEGGHFGSALLCPGGPYDFVEVSQGYGLDLATTDFTLEAWVQRWYDMYNMPHYGPQTIMGKSDIYNSGYALRIEEERLVLRLRLDYPTYSEVVIAGTTCMPADAWTHVAACRAGDRVQLFVNGVPDSMGWVTLPAWSNVSATSEPFRVGATACMGYPNGDSFYGLLDEVRLSSTARYVPPERFTPDDSGHGNHAEIRAGDGLVNGALSLSGYAETPSSPALALGAADFTIEASVYYTWNTYGYLVSGPGYNITVDADGRVSCSLYGADPPNPTLNLTAATTLGTYTWSQIALTRTGDTVTLLIGGYPAASGTFQGALPGYPGPLDFGPSYPMEYGTAYLALDEVRISTTTTPPSGIYASIYIPQDFDPEVADTIHYFHGLRDATAADPAFTESDTEPSSLLFRGTFQGVETTIAIDPATFPGLTPNVDSFQATITHTYDNGTTMIATVTFTETGAQSGVFRADLPRIGGGAPEEPEPKCQWVRKVDSMPGNVAGLYMPSSVRVRGIPEGLSGPPLAEFLFTLNGVQMGLEQHGEGYYLRGRSPWITLVIPRSDDPDRCYGIVWDDANGRTALVELNGCAFVTWLTLRGAFIGGAWVRALSCEIEADVYGDPARRIAGCQKRALSNTRDDDVRAIAGGHVQFRARLSEPFAAQLRFEWFVTAGVLEGEKTREDVNWDAPNDDSDVTVFVIVRSKSGNFLMPAFTRVKAVRPRVLRVAFVEADPDTRINLKDELKNALIDPPQYDRTVTDWETATGYPPGHEADLDHPWLKNADGKLFKNESAAYVKGYMEAGTLKGTRMKVMADVAGTDYVASAADRRDLSVATPIKLAVACSTPSLTFKNEDSGAADSSQFEVQDWSLPDYGPSPHQYKVRFISDQPVGGDPPKIRFYWEFTLDWTFKVKNKAGGWVNALGGTTTWPTVHRSLCVADRRPIIAPYTLGNDITAENTAWEAVMQYACDWGSGAATGASATVAERKAVVDRLWAGIKEATTWSTGARHEIEYTFRGGAAFNVRSFLLAKCRGSCGHQARFFASVAAAQGIGVDIETWDMTPLPGDADVVAVGAPDVDGNWCEYPGSPSGTSYWWYNTGGPGNHSFCSFGSRIYDPSFGKAQDTTWDRYLWEAITHFGFVSAHGTSIAWLPKSSVEAGTIRVRFGHRRNYIEVGTGVWPPVPSP
jgi:hypothetical protein